MYLLTCTQKNTKYKLKHEAGYSENGKKRVKDENGVKNVARRQF